MLTGHGEDGEHDLHNVYTPKRVLILFPKNFCFLLANSKKVGVVVSIRIFGFDDGDFQSHKLRSEPPNVRKRCDVHVEFSSMVDL